MLAPKALKFEKQNGKNRKRKASESHSVETNENSPNTKTVPKKVDINKGKNKKVPKKNSDQGGVPAIKCVIPKAYPHELTVEVSKLPMDHKQMDIIEAFNKYGSITYVQYVSKAKAIVAFLKEEEAAAAVLDNRSIRIGDQVLSVKKRSRVIKKADETADRTVFVFRVDPTITEEDIRKHFENCGEILFVKSKKRYFVIEFADKEAAQAALKLHNSILKEKILTVRLKSKQCVPWYPTRTVLLLNEDGLTNLDGSIVESIFAKCGEIENCDILCEKQKLAVITFKHEEDAAKALKLHGKNKNGLSIVVELYASVLERNAVPRKLDPYVEIFELAKAKKRKVYIKKISPQTTEKDLQKLFATCGAVEKVNILPERGAIIEFTDCDGYCKAFSLHGIEYKDQHLYLVPFSENIEKSVEKSKKLRSSNQNEPPRKIKKKA